MPRLGQDIQALHHTAFEYFLADLWSRLGYTTRVTAHNMRGHDVVVTSEDGDEFLLEAKRWDFRSNRISPQDIKKYAKESERLSRPIKIVTTSKFSRPAKREAGRSGIGLVNLNTLCKIVKTTDSRYLAPIYTSDCYRWDSSEDIRKRFLSQGINAPIDVVNHIAQSNAPLKCVEGVEKVHHKLKMTPKNQELNDVQIVMEMYGRFRDYGDTW